MAPERLHKVMANAGVASRRACEAMIQAGRVTVNGQVVTQLGGKVDPERDQIRVDGELLKPRPQAGRTYLMLYKPAGVLSVFDDPRGRPGLESLHKGPVRLYPVGRLDLDSEGLLLLTDDGDLTLKLSHPRFEHAKTYLVLVDRIPGTDALAHFRRGIQLEDGVTAPSQWRVLEHPAVVPPPADPTAAEGVWLHVTMHEGRKRQIRRMAAAEGLQVRRLVRISLGTLRLDRKLKPGESRPLNRREVEQLRSEVAGQAAPPVRRKESAVDERPARRVQRRPSGTGSSRPRRTADSTAAGQGRTRSGTKPAGQRPQATGASPPRRTADSTVASQGRTRSRTRPADQRPQATEGRAPRRSSTAGKPSAASSHPAKGADRPQAQGAQQRKPASGGPNTGSSHTGGGRPGQSKTPRRPAPSQGKVRRRPSGRPQRPTRPGQQKKGKS